MRKEHDEKKEDGKKWKSIMLHEKYDNMSKMILLSNTNKDNPYDL